MPTTVGLTEAKAKFSQLTREVNETGRVVTVYKNNKPWVDIVPRASSKDAPQPQRDYLEGALDTMEEYEDMFRELA